MQFSPTGRGGGGQHQFNPSLCPSLLQPEGHFPIWKHFCTILPLATQPPSAPKAKNCEPLGHARSGEARTALISRQPAKRHSFDGERIESESIFGPMSSQQPLRERDSGFPLTRYRGNLLRLFLGLKLLHHFLNVGLFPAEGALRCNR
jgi:hypothetical protein